MKQEDLEFLSEYELLLESSEVGSIQLLVRNVVDKVNCFTGSSFFDSSEFSIQDLERQLDEYDYSTEEFNSCPICNLQLKSISKYNDCCKSYTKSQVNMSSHNKCYWVNFICNPVEVMLKFPRITMVLFLQQNIPDALRSDIWRRFFLVLDDNVIPETSRLIFQNFQHSYTAEVSLQISKDLSRTFPEIDFFQCAEYIKNLSTVLNVYANYDAELGYCQGLLFLVGALFYNFKGNGPLTFHALVSIMESESELHDIFTPSSMNSTLESWRIEFLAILKKVDEELYLHLSKFVDFRVFLYSWWLSFVATNTPDISLIQKIIELCLVEGWKVGIFKVSLGLLISNRSVLLTLDTKEEEVVYQHMLSESKWGPIVGEANAFFWGLTMYDENLFQFYTPKFQNTSIHSKMDNLLNRLKNLSFISAIPSIYSTDSYTSKKGNSNSSSSIFSNNSMQNEDGANSQNSSITSEISDLYSGCTLQRPQSHQRENIPEKKLEDAYQSIKTENKKLKNLLEATLVYLTDENDSKCHLKEKIIGSLVN